ncbi:hypothetical protein DY000_02012974 [Brassica cretica]|uniref:Uncharacterized protein n=1 Tax=Brassica cretica TaxID=69181 RepID=A0ABQ7CZB6_BRACR|nr:hypothetical protein DY000_02012974 [Brassica cretica]
MHLVGHASCWYTFGGGNEGRKKITEFNCFEQAISSSPSPIRVRSIIKLSSLANQSPESILSRTIPNLAELLRVSDDPDRSVQAAANNTERPAGASRRTLSPFFEDTKQGAGATLRCGVTNPLQTGAGSGSEVINPRAIWSNEAGSRSDLSERGESPALEAERPGGATSSTRAQYEEMKQRAGATSRSEVRHPFWKPSDLVERLHQPASVSLLLIENLCFIWAFQVVD